MSRRVKEFVDIGDHVSLDELDPELCEVRDGLPTDAEAELQACAATKCSAAASPSPTSANRPKKKPSVEKRYAEAAKEAKERELERLQAELGVVCYAAPGKRGKLRIVA